MAKLVPVLALATAVIVLVALSARHTEQVRPSPSPAVVQTDVETMIAAEPTLGVVVDQNMRVVDVEAGSGAQHMGIQRDDVIVSIQGARLSSVETAREIVRQAKAGQQFVITVRRGNQNLTLNAVIAPTVGHPGQATPTLVPASQMYI